MREFIERFLSNYKTPPEPRADRIPEKWRVAVYLGVAALSLVALVLVVRYVVVPGVNAQQSSAQTGGESSPSKPAGE